jgi:hypothetical protein
VPYDSAPIARPEAVIRRARPALCHPYMALTGPDARAHSQAPVDVTLVPTPRDDLRVAVPETISAPSSEPPSSVAGLNVDQPQRR